MSLDTISRFDDYIKNICSYIKYKECHTEVSKELYSHMEDIYYEYINQGLSEKEAIEKSIARMGNCDEVGKRLNLAHKGSPDWITLILTLVLINIGVILTYFMKLNSVPTNSNNLFATTLKSSIMGSLIILILFLFDYRKIEKYSYHIFIITLILLSICTYIISNVVGTSPTLYKIDFINIISITPYLFIISLAGIFNNINLNEKYSFIKVFFLFITPLTLILKTGCLSPALIYSIGFITLAINCKIKIKFILGTLGSLFLMFISMISLSPYTSMRLISFINYHNDPNGYGYLNMQIQRQLNTITLSGKGFAFNPMGFPDIIHKELILNYIIYSLGWLGIAIIVSLFVGLIFRIIHITKYIHHSYGKSLICGFSSIFVVKIICNVLMNFNLFPITGIPLPFISYGFLYSLFNCLSIGIILSVYRRRSLSTFTVKK